MRSENFDQYFAYRPACEEAMSVKKRKINIRVKSSLPVPRFLSCESSTNSVIVEPVRRSQDFKKTEGGSSQRKKKRLFFKRPKI